jgi:hypothetical protein
MHASVAHDLLVQVPRLQNVALMICRQHDVGSGDTDDLVLLGAQVLKACLAFDQHVSRGSSVDAALSALRTRPQEYRPNLLDALSDLQFDAVSFRAQVVPMSRLEVGMVIDEDVRTNVGLLLVARGQETTQPMLARLRNFHQNGAIPGTVRVLTLRPDVDVAAEAS